MTLQRFQYAQLAATAWKNGGGVTRQILSVGEPFAWRVSIAEVASDGPFSIFEGVDRTIVLLEGPGLQLQSSDASVDHVLNQPFQPFEFSGDLAIQATQLGGASQDFNVMARRDAGQATVNVFHQACSISTAHAGLIYAACGDWEIDAPHVDSSLLLSQRDGLHWTAQSQQFVARPRVRVAACAPVLIAVSWRPC